MTKAAQRAKYRSLCRIRPRKQLRLSQWTRFLANHRCQARAYWEQDPTQRPRRYGWYSPTAAREMGSMLYHTPAGGEVAVTAVAGPELRDYYFPDTQYVGEVTEYLRGARKGLWSRHL